MPRYNGGFIGHDGLDAPDAPTIGTPSAESTQADIAFTAGAAGTTATTEFVATTNDGIGATGTSSPITITGLTNGTSYTARVYAKNSHGTSAASEASASFTPIANVIDGLFSTNLWDGGGSTATTITNGVDLSNKGGMVWIKSRTNPGTGHFHHLVDSERGQSSGFHKAVYSNGQEAENTYPSSTNGGVSSFNSNGFTVGPGSNNNYFLNNSGYEYVSWTFRKQPKFFDVVTYTGDGSAGRTVSHNLGSVPGMMMIKRLNSGTDWSVYHRGVDSSSPENYYLKLNENNARIDNDGQFNDTAPTATEFTLGAGSNTNASGGTYVAYLFAHNNNDGGFGETDDQDIIKCGSYTGNGSSTGPNVNVGFEPQWLMIKAASRTGEWIIHDNMRGMAVGGDDAFLIPDLSSAEQSGARVDLTANGFNLTTDGTIWNDNNQTYIYMAIRRGGMRTPTAASDVFDLDLSDSSSVPAFASNFPVDMAMLRDINGADTLQIGSRLQGTRRMSISTSAQEVNSYYEWDYQDGYFSSALNTNYFAWMWKRAKGYFDVVGYTGNGNSPQNHSHNLGVVPEMMWIKRRDDIEDWSVYHKNLPITNMLYLNTTQVSLTGKWASTAPTSSVFTTSGDDKVGANGADYIAYLFATLSGVSKVGSFTQSGATNVACGFTGSTPALIILKRTDSTGNWYIFDSTQGIVAGNDTHLYMNTTDAKITNADLIDPYSGGFATTSSLTNGSYIFYAIAAIS